MYYILYEGLKIDSNEPVYYTVYTFPIVHYNLRTFPFVHSKPSSPPLYTITPLPHPPIKHSNPRILNYTL